MIQTELDDSHIRNILMVYYGFSESYSTILMFKYIAPRLKL